MIINFVINRPINIADRSVSNSPHSIPRRNICRWCNILRTLISIITISGHRVIVWERECTYGWAPAYHLMPHSITSNMRAKLTVSLTRLSTTETQHHREQQGTIHESKELASKESLTLRLNGFIKILILFSCTVFIFFSHNQQTTSRPLDKHCVLLKAPKLKWEADDCLQVKDFICKLRTFFLHTILSWLGSFIKIIHLPCASIGIFNFLEFKDLNYFSDHDSNSKS